ncbi:hypothetical protein Pelo_17959 [Pelomyxa schiedti]|nr:hypothetical protein Pelo_17959 [Pelomyxa schiedti]
MVIFDLADCSSFDSVKVWFREIERYTAITPAKILVGNKRDLTIEIDDAEPTQIANHYGIKYLKVSAKTGEGVADAFTQLAAECLRKAMPAAAPEPEIVVTPVDTPKPSAPPKESAHREKKEGGCSV